MSWTENNMFGNAFERLGSLFSTKFEQLDEAITSTVEYGQVLEQLPQSTQQHRPVSFHTDPRPSPEMGKRAVAHVKPRSVCGENSGTSEAELSKQPSIIVTSPSWSQENTTTVNLDLSDELQRRRCMRESLRKSCKSVVNAVSKDPKGIAEQLYQLECFSEEELLAVSSSDVDRARYVFSKMLAKDLHSMLKFTGILGNVSVNAKKQVLELYTSLVSEGFGVERKCVHCLIVDRVSPTLVLDEFLSSDAKYEVLYEAASRMNGQDREKWQFIFKRSKEIAGPDEIAHIIESALQQSRFHSDIHRLVQENKKRKQEILDCVEGFCGKQDRVVALKARKILQQSDVQTQLVCPVAIPSKLVSCQMKPQNESQHNEPSVPPSAPVSSQTQRVLPIIQSENSTGAMDDRPEEILPTQRMQDFRAGQRFPCRDSGVFESGTVDEEETGLKVVVTPENGERLEESRQAFSLL